MDYPDQNYDDYNDDYNYDEYEEEKRSKKKKRKYNKTGGGKDKDGKEKRRPGRPRKSETVVKVKEEMPDNDDAWDEPSAKKSKPSQPKDGEEPFKKECKICMFSYNTQKYFDHDAKIHKERLKNYDQPVKCPICREVVEFGHKINEHIEQAHPESQLFTCPDHSKILLPKDKIKRHQTSRHANHYASAICPICGKQLTKQNTLTVSYFITS